MAQLMQPASRNDADSLGFPDARGRVLHAAGRASGLMSWPS
jgi:hypothetical protein